MVYFCADDYGISAKGDERIENCIKNGVLNKISVLPNGDAGDFKKKTDIKGATLSLHINLVEGYPLADKKDIDLLLAEDGSFKYSFMGLLKKSLSPGRKKFENQLYNEIRCQLRFWKEKMGDGAFFIDSHQHTHMIPVIFKTLIKVIKDEGINAEYIRIPSEPLLPYILTPFLYFSYKPVGIIKQWVLKACYLFNKRELEKSKIKSAYFMGVMFSGKMEEKTVRKLLPRYMALAGKKGKDIELGFHPGYIDDEKDLILGNRAGFKNFYLSPYRKKEHDALINLKGVL